MINESGKNHKINLNKDFFNNLKFDTESLKQYRTEAAVRCANTLGSKPVLCLSGGIDSQAMVQCWKEAGLKFDVAIAVFNNNLNKQDSDHAKLFCNKYDIPYKELKIDIIQFLNRENYSIAQKYNSYSPHFNVHYKIVEILAEMGYTGACFGGVTPYKKNNIYGNNFSGAPFHFLKIQNKLPIPMQGSFLSFYPELAWAIGLQCESVEHEEEKSLEKFVSQEQLDYLNDLRYLKKIKSYKKTKLKIIPQDKKYTGFELVKEYYAEKFNDGWAFEKRFRHPIVKAFCSDKQNYAFDFLPDVLKTIDLIYSKNIGSN